jgi:hypothetical protein
LELGGIGESGGEDEFDLAKRVRADVIEHRHIRLREVRSAQAAV